MMLGCAAATQARAESWFAFEAGIGAAKYQDRGDGIWYQEGAPSWSESLTAPAFTAGRNGPLRSRGKWGIDWHADYVYVGTARSICECTPVDEDYDSARHIIKSPLPVDVPDAYFVGSGHLQGIALVIEPYYMYRGIRLGVSAGLFPHIPSWTENVYGWSVAPGMTPRNISVNSGHHISIGEVIGMSVGYRNLSLSLQHYFLPTQHTKYPPIWSGANVLMMRYRF